MKPEDVKPEIREKTFQKVLKAAEDYRLFKIRECFEMAGIPESTFYLHCPSGSDELQRIREQIQENRSKVAVHLRKKWLESGSPATQIALYKLVCDKEEYHRLSNTELKVEKTEKKEVDLSKLSDEELEELERLYEKMGK